VSVLRPGTVVVATKVIIDYDEHGAFHICAIRGTLGVVLKNDFIPEYPIISWHGGEVCNVKPDCFDIYGGEVEQVVD
jgi:hypothetical protein